MTCHPGLPIRTPPAAAAGHAADAAEALADLAVQQVLEAAAQALRPGASCGAAQEALEEADRHRVATAEQAAAARLAAELCANAAREEGAESEEDEVGEGGGAVDGEDNGEGGAGTDAEDSAAAAGHGLDPVTLFSLEDQLQAGAAGLPLPEDVYDKLNPLHPTEPPPAKASRLSGAGPSAPPAATRTRAGLRSFTLSDADPQPAPAPRQRAQAKQQDPPPPPAPSAGGIFARFAPPDRDTTSKPGPIRGRQWAVDAVVDCRRVGNNVKYRVLWKGYPDDQATWESPADVSTDLVRA